MAYKNFAYSLVATAPSPAASGLSLTVTAADGAKFPAVPFNVTIWPTAAQPSTTNAEIATVTAVSTDTFTITRTREGTSARTVVVGDQIAATYSAAVADIPQVNLAPAGSETVMAGYSTVAARAYTVASGQKLTVGMAGRMRIL